MDGAAAGDIWVEAWLAIWIRPRATMRRIVAADPRKFVLGIAFVAGALAALGMRVNMAVAPIAPAHMPMRMPHLGPFGVAIAALLTGGFSVAMLYAFGALYRWSGAILGGTADAISVRAALAWSRVPSIFITIVDIFAAAIWMPSASSMRHPTLSPFGLIGLVGGIWSFVISLKCLGEVHGFSAWRALGAILLGFLAIIVVSVAVAITIWLAVVVGRALA